MRLLQNLLIGFVLISGPVCLGSIAWGLRLILEQVPLAVFLLICASYVSVALGIAALFDKRQG